MFKSIKNNWRKAQAAVIIEILLDKLAAQGIFDGKPNLIANKIVEKVWELRPELFDGRRGHYPHKVIAAATVLALTAERAPSDGNVFPIVMICLGNILSDTDANPMSWPFSPQDIMLLDAARAIFVRLSMEEDDLGLDEVFAQGGNS